MAETPPSAPLVLPDESVLVFTSASSLLIGGENARRIRVGGSVLFFIVTFVATFFLIGTGRNAWISLGVGALIATGAAIGIRQWGRPPRTFRELVAKSVRSSVLGSNARVRCYGSLAQISRVLAGGRIEDCMFEPRTYFAIAAAPAPKERKRAEIVAGVAVFAMLTGLEWHFGSRLGGNIYLNMMSSVAAGLLIGGMIYPTYIRVVPGRIDIMECGRLGQRIVAVRRINLRGEPIVMNLRAQVFAVGAAKDAPLIAFAGVRDRWGFAHAVLCAAVSSHTPPPLPDDELLG